MSLDREITLCIAVLVMYCCIGDVLVLFDLQMSMTVFHNKIDRWVISADQ